MRIADSSDCRLSPDVSSLPGGPEIEMKGAGRVPRLPEDTVFLGLQIRSVDPNRLVALAGRLPDGRIPEVCAVLRYLVEG